MGRPPTRHQVVSGVASSKSFWFGLRFGSRWCAKHPGLTANLVPDSNTMEDRTPLWHNNQRQVGAGRSLTRHQVVCFWSRTLKKLLIWVGSDLGCRIAKQIALNFDDILCFLPLFLPPGLFPLPLSMTKYDSMTGFFMAVYDLVALPYRRCLHPVRRRFQERQKSPLVGRAPLRAPRCSSLNIRQTDRHS